MRKKKRMTRQAAAVLLEELCLTWALCTSSLTGEAGNPQKTSLYFLVVSDEEY